ncbi:MAG: 4Fe-4S cluster-binding domain-containing protein, partial [Lentisphaerota bacterium]
IIPSSLMIYLKTTETCQLNCKHCFTNGTNGRKIYFDPDATIDWFNKLHDIAPNVQGGNITFHGGEPFLAPIEDMRKVWDACKDLWPNVWWSATTNLVFKLTDERRQFMKDVFPQGLSTSWDKDMRFDTTAQEELWRKNLAILLEDGHNITLNISVNKAIIQMDPDELVKFLMELGVHWVNFERITPNGNANLNAEEIFPTNVELDAWIVRLWEASEKLESHKVFGNLLFDSVLTSFVHTTHSGCRCRSCEQKIFTINADGAIGGCPNSAVNNTFGFISDDIEDLLMSEGRLENIACESQRNPGCYGCEVFDICNGDCHQLVWQDNVCAAPKSLMKKFKAEQNFEHYKNVLNGFVGVE